MTRLSVIVITRNQAWNVARLLESVIRHTETVPEREIVLVDSASTDTTVESARKFPVMVIRLHPDQRLTAALGRHVGYQHAAGDYVLFLDGDMELIPGWVERAIAVLDAQPDIGGIAGEVYERPLTYRGAGVTRHDQFNLTSEIFDTPHGGGAAMYRRAALEQVGGFDPQLYSDEEPELCLRLRHAGWRIVRMKHPIAFHYSHARQNISTLLRRRKRHLYLGFGQNIRRHLHDSLLGSYVRERGFGLLPGLFLLLLAPVVVLALLTGRTRFLRRLGLLGVGGFVLDTIRRGSIYESVYGLLQRLIIVEGTLRGFLLERTPIRDIKPQFEIVKRATGDNMDLPQIDPDAIPQPQTPADRKLPRVLVVGPVFRGKQAGGIEMFNEILLASDLWDRYELLHLDTTRTESGAGKAGTLALINFYYFFKQIVELIAIFIFRRPAVMHQPITDRIAFWKEGVFMLLGRLFGVPVLGHVHGCMFKELFEGKNWLVRQGIKRVLMLPNVTIALSEGWRSFMVENIDPNLTVIVVPNTVDSRIATLAHTNHRERSGDEVTVLFMAALHKRKGILEALQAIEQIHAEHPNVRFVFAGGIKAESERAEIERARDALRDNDRVEFPGIVTGDAKTRLFEQADIFILPSYFENFPIAVLEAMAAGLSLVVTPVGALPEVLHDDTNCLFIEAGDVDGLAASITRLVADPDLRAAQGAANAALFRERFDQPAVLEKIEQAYVTAMQYVTRAG